MAALALVLAAQVLALVQDRADLALLAAQVLQVDHRAALLRLHQSRKKSLLMKHANQDQSL